MASTQIRGSTQIQPGTVTSTQVNSSIIVANGSNAFTGAQSMGGFNLNNLATPLVGTDAATKAYVDSLANGKDWKESCRVASTANVTLSAPGASIDGVTLNNGDRVLLKSQTNAPENGIYVFNGSAAALTRAGDAGNGQITSAATTFVTEGSTNAGKEFTVTTADPITLGTTALSWTQSNAGSVYTGSNGISVAGSVISPAYGNAANTVCQGNDPRLSDNRSPVGTTLTSSQVWVGSSSNTAAAVALSGDAQISNGGVVTVANQVRLAKVITREAPTGTINGSNTTFALANVPVSGTESVFLNGILQDAGTGNDYTISGNTITMLSAPLTGDKLKVNYISQ